VVKEGATVMGKAADNERLKLRAVFFNNLSVACFVTGLFIPYLALLRGWGQSMNFFEAVMAGNWKSAQGEALGLLAAVIALSLGFVFRRRADKIAGSIED
jgi:hypothetical protein